MTARRLVMLVAALAVVAAAAASALPRPETAEGRVARISAELRCPVCQGLSVADSPSDTARSMRAIVGQRVAEGRTDDEIRDEFRRSYGNWILLTPPLLDPRGLVWVVPLAAVAAGALAALRRVRQRAPAPARIPAPGELEALRDRAAREEALEG